MINKAVSSPLLVFSLYSPNGTYDEQFLGNYATININDELLRVPGVGQTTAFGARSRRAMLALIDQRSARIERAERLLAAFSYREVLKRGFTLVRDAAGQPLRTAAEVKAGTRLDIEFSDGRVGAVAEGEARMRPPPVPRRARRGGEGSGGQGSLF